MFNRGYARLWLIKKDHRRRHTFNVTSFAVVAIFIVQNAAALIKWETDFRRQPQDEERAVGSQSQRLWQKKINKDAASFIFLKVITAFRLRLFSPRKSLRRLTFISHYSQPDEARCCCEFCIWRDEWRSLRRPSSSKVSGARVLFYTRRRACGSPAGWGASEKTSQQRLTALWAVGRFLPRWASSPAWQKRLDVIKVLHSACCRGVFEMGPPLLPKKLRLLLCISILQGESQRRTCSAHDRSCIFILWCHFLGLQPFSRCCFFFFFNSASLHFPTQLELNMTQLRLKDSTPVSKLICSAQPKRLYVVWSLL